MSWSVADTAKTTNTRRNVHFDTSQDCLDQILNSLDDLAQSLPDRNNMEDRPNFGNNNGIYNNNSGYRENGNFNDNHSSSRRTLPSKPDSISIPVTSMDSEANSVFPSVRATRQRLRGDDYGHLKDHRGYDESDAILGQPYHTVADSKPFSYIRSNSSHSRPVSRTSQFSSLSDHLDKPRSRLRSPGLLRKAMGDNNTTDELDDFDREEKSPWLLEQQRKLRLRQQQQEQQQRSTLPSRPSSAMSSSYLMGNSEPGTRETSPFPIEAKHHVYAVPIQTDYSNHDGNSGHFGTWNNIHDSKKRSNESTTNVHDSNEMRWHPSRLVRQKSDSAFDRTLAKRRLRHLEPRRGRSPAGDELNLLTMAARKLNASIGGNLDNKWSSSRPQTPSFPASGTATPYADRGRRASSVSSTSATSTSVSPLVAKRTWYRPDMSRDQVVQILTNCREGAFIIRDSRTYPGAFGLAVRVDSEDLSGNNEDLIRHFLIEPVKNGVRLRGYGKEPIFTSLAALVHQHTLTKLALPILLKVENCPDSTPNQMQNDNRLEMAQHLLQVGAACDLLYLHSVSTGKLTGPAALARAMDDFVEGSVIEVVKVHFKINGQGLIITDCGRQNFFRQFFACNNISYCGFEPQGRLVRGKSVFGIVAKDVKGDGSNKAHVFAEGDQPGHSVVGFVNKVLSVVNNSNNNNYHMGN